VLKCYILNGIKRIKYLHKTMNKFLVLMSSSVEYLNLFSLSDRWENKLECYLRADVFKQNKQFLRLKPTHHEGHKMMLHKGWFQPYSKKLD
jgi:hypothetical protein